MAAPAMVTVVAMATVRMAVVAAAVVVVVVVDTITEMEDQVGRHSRRLCQDLLHRLITKIVH